MKFRIAFLLLFLIPIPGSHATSRKAPIPLNLGEQLPTDTFKYTLQFFSSQELFRSGARLNHEYREEAYEIDQRRWDARIQHLEALMGDWIDLPNSSDQIMTQGISQELWVLIMQNNPSFYKEKHYCPDTFKVLSIRGKKIRLCPRFPVDGVVAKSIGRQDSNAEFIEALNKLYKDAGQNVTIRAQSLDEYTWAETAGGREPKLPTTPDLGKFFPFIENSNRDPLHPDKPSPSGKHQPRDLVHNSPNSLGFRRSGVWEATRDEMNSMAVFVGGTWNFSREGCASGRFELISVTRRYWNYGASRLVRSSF